MALQTNYVPGVAPSTPNAIGVQSDGGNQVVAIAAPGGGAAITPAQDGTDSTDANATQATAGVGIRGWLSTLVSLFRAGTAKVTILPVTSSSGTPAAVAQTTTASTVLIAANSNRKNLVVYNDTSTGNLLIAYGTTCTTSNFSVKVAAGGYWEMPWPPDTRALSCVWDATGSGNARVTDLS